MRSAAARSREETGVGSQAILQGLQIEVASVNPNPLRCFGWEQSAASRWLAGLRNGFHDGFPLVFHIPDLFPLITLPIGVLEIRHGRSEVSNVPITRIQRGCLNQCARFGADHSDRHANCLYLA